MLCPRHRRNWARNARLWWHSVVIAMSVRVCSSGQKQKVVSRSSSCRKEFHGLLFWRDIRKSPGSKPLRYINTFYALACERQLVPTVCASLCIHCGFCLFSPPLFCFMLFRLFSINLQEGSLCIDERKKPIRSVLNDRVRLHVLHTFARFLLHYERS